MAGKQFEIVQCALMHIILKGLKGSQTNLYSMDHVNVRKAFSVSVCKTQTGSCDSPRVKAAFSAGRPVCNISITWGGRGPTGGVTTTAN